MAVHVTRTGVALTVGVIILALAAFGTLYLLKEQGEQARRQDAIQVAEEQLEAEANGEVALNDDSDEARNDDVAGSPSTDGAGAGNGAETITETGVDAGANSAGELPQTGPTDNALTALLAGILTFVAVSYGRSLRSIRRSFGSAV